ncbi:TIGR04255 family protein [Parasphingopyxis algicola]|uniref:TIGR04255 family protein n=1 Tax=Parasphingopyxis algicola TaxID=2026624 RepID=UPI0015A464A7|nr:TIGR04255 family protein [Parasphingopyxis algicola]QLC25668.1 TIGR04255 family protein [Parasphingopyxis algicola]
MKLKFPDEASAPTDALPEYESPPVVETSIGVQFEGLEGFQSLHAASFWERIRDKYVRLEERPPLDPAFETFGPRSAPLGVPELQMIQAPIQPRFFFISEDDSELVQLQKDRLFFNWRKRPGAEEYPRYVHVREKIESLFQMLRDWSRDEGLGKPRPTQCEAIYVNIIPLVDSAGEACGLSYVFPWLVGMMGTTEDGVFKFRRVLQNQSGIPVARLHVSLEYGTEEESRRSARLNLHVRGHPAEQTFNKSLEMIDAEREIIVRTFTEITSKEAHMMWERQK